jgi:methylenetetrahydrofolate dehydrogenase (NADP+)/methenyltetrahydrofolate cyclohydrolase
MIIDGKKIAEEIIAALEKERSNFGALSLAVVSEGEDAATESFIKIKSRVATRLNVEVRRFTPAEISEALLCDGIIVQLPIPNAAPLLAAIPPEKDVDAITEGDNPPTGGVRAPVAEAVSEIFTRHSVAAAGKKAVVVGAGKLVGAPVAELLKYLGADVQIITKNEGSLSDLKDADIVVLGAGEPGLVKPEMLKEGVVLIDAGTSEASGRLAGDADPACAEVASVFTPVPGGIGPIAVAMIFKNLFILAKNKPV